MLMPIHPAMPLSKAKAGRTMEVVDLIGGERSTRRLLEMGLYCGASVEVVSGRGWGPVVLKLAGSRLALGRGMAKKILVRDS
jgi:ferrous iron transport protein A